MSFLEKQITSAFNEEYISYCPFELNLEMKTETLPKPEGLKKEEKRSYPRVTHYQQPLLLAGPNACRFNRWDLKLFTGIVCRCSSKNFIYILNVDYHVYLNGITLFQVKVNDNESTKVEFNCTKNQVLCYRYVGRIVPEFLNDAFVDVVDFLSIL